jgi:hypothetical protein
MYYSYKFWPRDYFVTFLIFWYLVREVMGMGLLTWGSHFGFLWDLIGYFEGFNDMLRRLIEEMVLKWINLINSFYCHCIALNFLYFDWALTIEGVSISMDVDWVVLFSWNCYGILNGFHASCSTPLSFELRNVKSAFSLKLVK